MLEIKLDDLSCFPPPQYLTVIVYHFNPELFI